MGDGGYITVPELARRLGRSGENVRHWCRRLGIWDDLPVTGSRGVKVLTPDQVSEIVGSMEAVAGGPIVKPEAVTKEPELEANKGEDAALHAAMDAQSRALDLLADQIERLREAHEGEVTRMRVDFDARIGRLEDENARLRAELERARACIDELAVARWWQRRGVVARYALPAPRGEIR